MQVGRMVEGGEVFVPDMGKPVEICGLACTVINLSGLALRDINNPGGDIAIEEIGLWPDEALFEEVLMARIPCQQSISELCG